MMAEALQRKNEYICSGISKSSRLEFLRIPCISASCLFFVHITCGHVYSLSLRSSFSVNCQRRPHPCHNLFAWRFLPNRIVFEDKSITFFFQVFNQSQGHSPVSIEQCIFKLRSNLRYVLEALSFGAANIRNRRGTTPHDCFPVDLGFAATINNDTASGVLFHNYTTPHDRFRVDPSMPTNNAMGTGTQMEWSAFLNYILFDDVLEL